MWAEWLVWVHFAATISQHAAALTQQHVALYDDPMRSSDPSTASVPGSASHMRSLKENGVPILLTGVSADLAVSVEGRRDSAMRSSVSKASSVHTKRDSVFSKKTKAPIPLTHQHQALVQVHSNGTTKVGVATHALKGNMGPANQSMVQASGGRQPPPNGGA